jgi:hypothetical protein
MKPAGLTNYWQKIGQGILPRLLISERRSGTRMILRHELPAPDKAPSLSLDLPVIFKYCFTIPAQSGTGTCSMPGRVISSKKQGVGR